MSPSTIPQDVQGIAYVLLFAQHPDLTPEQFKAWLHVRVQAIAHAAKKGRA